MSIRLLLELSHTEGMGRWIEPRLVSSHMRVLFSIPSHREYLITGTPSEPILAEAAAHVMDSEHRNGLEYCTETLDCLLRWTANGLLKVEDMVYYIARCLLTAAHDAVIVHEQGGVLNEYGFYKSRPGLHFSSPIRLVDFIEALFQPQHAKTILDSRPQEYSKGQTLRTAFKNAYIHFTHFGLLEPRRVVDALAFAGICRGMGWSFMHSKDFGVNIGIPIFLGGTKDPVDRWNMTMMFIQVGCAGDIVIPIPDMDSEVGFFTKAPDGREDKRPYIVLNMNVGLRHPFRWSMDPDELAAGAVITSMAKVKKEAATLHADSREDPSSIDMSVDDDNSQPTHPRYSITATGCTCKVYRVLQPRDTYKCVLLLERGDPELQNRTSEQSCRSGAFGTSFHEGSFGLVEFENPPHDERVWDIDELEGVTVDD
jgi:hypothetical protein